MKLQYKLIRLILFIIITIVFLESKAQSYIKVYGQKVNHLDKQNRKQGDWIFFDNQGFVQMTCVFQDDICISPYIFYENSDTVFVRFPPKDSVEGFVLFQDNKKYKGAFIHTSDTTTVVEMESNSNLDDNLILKIKKYKELTIEPNYFFGQKKMNDYLSASFSSSNIIFNKPLSIILYVNSSGKVTKVEFPNDKTYLSSNEVSELTWIYSTMPRWQPLFFKNKIIPVKIKLSINSTLSILSFDH
jgi:hypothetical protein